MACGDTGGTDYSMETVNEATPNELRWYIFVSELQSHCFQLFEQQLKSIPIYKRLLN